jgi:hypothetical protein
MSPFCGACGQMRQKRSIYVAHVATTLPMDRLFSFKKTIENYENFKKKSFELYLY